MIRPHAAAVYRFRGRRQWSKRNDWIEVNAIVEVRPFAGAGLLG